MSTKVSGRAHFSSRDLVSDVTTSRVLWASLAVLQLAVAYPQHGVKTGRFISCKKDTEYLHNGICCAKCEAGQYVQTPCTETGKKGTCEECDYGTFTEHANGLKQCIKCTQCPPDQEIVRVCSHTQDTLCRCKPGRYCHPDEACEICKKCSRCNSDEEVVKNCTSTSNTECKKLPGKTSPEADTTLTAVLTVFFVVLFLVLVTIIFILWRKKWRTADSNSFNEGCISVSRPHGTKPSTYANIYKPQGKEETINLYESNPSSASSSQHNLTDPAETLPWEDPNRREEEPFPTLIPKNGVESLVACFEFFEELNVDFHNRFFRKLSIEDNEIRSKDHLSHEDRIHYLLSYWVEKKGKEASLNHLLRALLDLNQRRTAETVMEKSIQKGFYELESLSVGDN
ncbi:tumor necrosis factor receptor superfamily member 10B-like isoform X1 [Xiphophorus hellerii]|uniref:tumor necrosis factor receptor superfamily member 10B-like isoform X1 n=1 Tax=Xiphophorus hellerii TaxID=8084 RepID=UPI0013B36862|nr:tumor necrosis factor receptor superfamily member 10B-like isoform X1 [Xiphophorus hellerii]